MVMARIHCWTSSTALSHASQCRVRHMWLSARPCVFSLYPFSLLSYFLPSILFFLTYSFGYGGGGRRKCRWGIVTVSTVSFEAFFFPDFFPTPSSAFTPLPSHSDWIALVRSPFLLFISLSLSFCHECKILICFGILNVRFNRRRAAGRRLMVCCVYVRSQLMLRILLLRLQSCVLLLTEWQGSSGA